MNIFQNLNLKTVNMKKYLIKEIEINIKMLNNEIIDKDDFVQAITEICEHYKD